MSNIFQRVVHNLWSRRFGRKPVYYWSLVFHLAAMVMNAFPINYPWVAMTRFLMGAGNAGKYLTGFLLSRYISLSLIMPPYSVGPYTFP